MIWGENPLFLETPICDLFVDPIVVHLPLTAQETSIEAQIDTVKNSERHVFRAQGSPFFTGAELFWEFFFFFFRDFFFFGWGWFWGCPGSFLGKPRGERQVRAGFSGHLGVVLGLSRLRSGETSGEMQVPSRFGHKKLLQKANCPVHFCFLCVFIYVDVCVCL